MKRCANCEESLPREYFTLDKRRADGRCPYCRVCEQMRKFLRYRRDRDTELARSAAYAKAHPEANRAAVIRYKLAHPDRVRAGHQRRTREQRRAEYLRLREATVARARRWRKEHPGASTRMVRDWCQRNPDRARAIRFNSAGRRRALERGGEPIRQEHLREIVARQEGACAYCHEPLGTRFHFDHVVPLSRGGAHAPGNLCAACPRCNRKKQTMTGEEFLATLAGQQLP